MSAPFSSDELARRLKGHREGEAKMSHARESCDLCRWSDTLDALGEEIENLLTRAESADARLADIVGVTREQLAAREYARGRREALAEVQRGMRDAVRAGMDAAIAKAVTP